MSELSHDALDPTLNAQITSSFVDKLPFTILGLSLTGLAYYLLLTYGEAESDLILFTGMYLILALIFLINNLHLFVAWRLNKRLLSYQHARPLNAEVDQNILTGYNIDQMLRFPMFNLTVRWDTPDLSRYELITHDGQLEELISFRRRGRYQSATRRFTLEDHFGLTRSTWILRAPLSMMIQPQTTQLQALSLKQIQEGEDHYDPSGQPHGDLVELRRYQDGDPLKLVIWRLYARSRQLMVRSPEVALSPREDVIAYFVAHSSDEASASTFQSFLNQGQLGEQFTVFADGADGGATTLAEAQEHILLSAQGKTGSALPTLLALPPQRLRGCVLFASVLTPQSELLNIVQAVGGRPTVILSYAFNPEPSKKTWMQRFFLQQSETTTATSTLLEGYETYLAVQKLGAIPLLISQPSGQLITERALQELSIRERAQYVPNDRLV